MSQTMETDHPQIYVKNALGYRPDSASDWLPDTRLIKARINTYVDKDIEQLLRDIWDCGVHTMFSCQGDADNDPYVMFGLNSDLTVLLVEKILKRNGKTINTVADPGNWEEPYWPSGKLGHITWIYEEERAKIQENSSTQLERNLEVTMSDVDAKAVRAWAVTQGKTVKARGRLPKALVAEYQAAVEAGTAEAQNAANTTPVAAGGVVPPQGNVKATLEKEEYIFPAGFTPARANEIPF